jgi:uncharacterized protein YggT (Ycf19 family)
MGLIDFILNLAGLLLWLNWRSIRFDPLNQATARTLIGTLRKAERHGAPRWQVPALLAGLMLFRALLYWQIGPALDWTAKLDLAARTLYFRSDFFGRIFLYSIVSFAGTLGVFYLWLLFVAIVNRRVSDDEPFLKLARLHLGRVARWPLGLQCFLPLAIMAALWLALHPLLVRWEILTPSRSPAQLLTQALIMGVGSYLPLRFCAAFFLLLHLLNSYIYLGKHPLWGLVNTTARNLLAPLRRLPLRVGKVDFSPVLAIALVFALAEIVRYWLPRIIPA